MNDFNLALAAALLGLSGIGCISSSQSGSADGGGGGGGDGGGAGGACWFPFYDGGPPIQCLETRINGGSTTPSQAQCTEMGANFVPPTTATFATSCPTTNLVGCCTSPDNTGVGTATMEECYYDVEIDGSAECLTCGLDPDASASGTPTFASAAETAASCRATGLAGNPGTWSTTP